MGVANRTGPLFRTYGFGRPRGSELLLRNMGWRWWWRFAIRVAFTGFGLHTLGTFGERVILEVESQNNFSHIPQLLFSALHEADDVLVHFLLLLLTGMYHT